MCWWVWLFFFVLCVLFGIIGLVIVVYLWEVFVERFLSAEEALAGTENAIRSLECSTMDDLRGVIHEAMGRGVKQVSFRVDDCVFRFVVSELEKLGYRVKTPIVTHDERALLVVSWEKPKKVKA